MTSPRVLIVDDDEHVCRTTCWALDELAVCDAVHDVPGARQALRAVNYDVVLLDVSMPKVSGLELLDELATNWPRAATIMLTANDDLACARDALDRGAVAYVVKPFRLNDLRLAVLSAVAAQHRPAIAERSEARTQIVEAIEHARSNSPVVLCLVAELAQTPVLRAVYGDGATDRLNAVLCDRLRTLDPTIQVFGGVSAGRVTAVVSLDGPTAIPTTTRRIYQEVSAPAVIDERPVPIRTLVGFSHSNDSSLTSGLLLERAEAAAAAASRDERELPFVTYDDVLWHAARDRMELIAEAHAGVGTEHIYVAYQPQVDTRAGNCVGMEALARWQHPRYGDIPPSVFVSVAEQSGWIDALGEHVLRNACRSFAELRQLYPHLVRQLSVNVAAPQLDSARFPSLVAGALRDAAMEPRELCLELTESLLLDNATNARRHMALVASSGVQFSVDDFGTGYSSFEYLTSLPWNELKLDRAVTAHFDHPAGKAVLEAIFTMGKALHLDVVAEGVETKAQLATLRRLGCRIAQGFLFSKPLPFGELVSHLAINQGRYDV